MNHASHSLILPDEVLSKITATFELPGRTGVNYKFGIFIATDKRLTWHTKLPFGLKETNIYRYRDIFHVNVAQSLF
ncbi:MAG: hypothetical protein Q8934_16750 [Bacillota bacterium]|nr:hypothetical protein [Bacillota bacterium]